MFVAVLPSNGAGAHHRPRAITQRPRVVTLSVCMTLLELARLAPTTLGRIDGQMLHTDADGAAFTVHRSNRVIFRKQISDMANPNGWLGVSNDSRRFALNTSNGGAAVAGRSRF